MKPSHIKVSKETKIEREAPNTITLAIVTSLVLSSISIVLSFISITNLGANESHQIVSPVIGEATVPNIGFHASTTLPIITVNERLSPIQLNKITYDTNTFSNTRDSDTFVFKNSGKYIIGYNVLWTGLQADEGSTREVWVSVNQKNVEFYSRHETKGNNYLQQHISAVSEFRTNDVIDLVVKQNSQNNITVAKAELWVQLICIQLNKFT